MAAPTGIQIDRLSIADQVYEHLRTAILSGQLEQGARVVEAQIAKSLEISRAPVREAVNRLLQDGLLESRTHFGTSVVRMTMSKMRSLYELRAAIEGLAIRDVTRNRRDIDLSPLSSCIAAMKHHARKGELGEFVEAEIEFHRILCELSGNPYIIRVGEMLNAQIKLALTIDNSSYENLADAADEHEPVLKAIESGDAEKARMLIEEHILSSLESTLIKNSYAAD